jgi:lipopolysaccharide export system protein LptA
MLAATGASAQGIDFSQGGAVEVTARGGFEWRENEQVVIATGDARAVRGDVTVLADRLIARYRKKGTGPNGTVPAPAPAGTTTAATAGSPDSGGNEVYRLEAEQNVRIFTPTDYAQGDHAVYDIDQAVLLMTGHDLKLTTPQQVMTARDSMEYWSQRHVAVGRGHAVVVTSDGRRLAADVLVGYTADPNAPPTPQTVAAKPTADAGKPADPLMASGKLKRVEAFGNVEVRTQTDIVRGDRGVYVPDTGIARVVGHVRITHGDNQINGPAADVNMKTGIAHLVSDTSQRVQGLLMPNNAQGDAGLGALTTPAKQAAPKPGAPKAPAP